MDISTTSVINALTGSKASGRSAATTFHQNSSENITKSTNSNADVVSISKAAYARNEKEIQAIDPVKSGQEEKAEVTDKRNNKDVDKNTATNEQNTKNNTNPTQLSEDDLKQVQDLKKRDSEVRRHEAAHLATAGKYATGGASYEFKRGPDGKNYAAGGEVGIDTSPIAGDPQATLQKAQQIRSAAQAPANPSSQDRQVAASATQMETKARQEIAGLTLNPNSPVDQPAENSGSVSGKVNSGEVKGEKESDTTKSEPNNTEKTISRTEAIAASAYQAVGGMTSSQNPSIMLVA